MSTRSYRDLVTTLALAAILLMATAARADGNGEPTTLLDVLAGINGTAVGKRGLGEDVDRAAARLRAQDRRDATTSVTRGQTQPTESLGIGALGEPMGDPRGLPAIYAHKDGATKQVTPLRGEARSRAQDALSRASADVAACYGDPLLGTDVVTDALVVQVVIDANGRVESSHILEHPRLAASNMESCVRHMLGQLLFPAGLTRDVAAVEYRWRFELRGPAKFDFTAPAPTVASSTSPAAAGV